MTARLLIDDIALLADMVASAVANLSTVGDQVEALNRLREALHEVSPLWVGRQLLAAVGARP